MKPREELIKEEETRMRRLKFLVDIIQAVLMQSDMTLSEALDMAENAKRAALGLFPDKESVYDLVYAPRFRRIIDERFTISGTSSGRN